MAACSFATRREVVFRVACAQVGEATLTASALPQLLAVRGVEAHTSDRAELLELLSKAIREARALAGGATGLPTAHAAPGGGLALPPPRPP